MTKKEGENPNRPITEIQSVLALLIFSHEMQLEQQHDVILQNQPTDKK